MNLPVLVKIFLLNDDAMNVARLVCCLKFSDELQILFEINNDLHHMLLLLLKMLSPTPRSLKFPILMDRNCLMDGLWILKEI